MKPWRLADLPYDEVRSRAIEVAVIPFGATEPHNLHLPYGTDTLEAETVGDAICGEAYAQGAKVVLLPTIPYGTETNQRGFPLSLNLYPSTLFAIIRDLVESLSESGVRKIVLLNSHGGNDFKPILRELYGRFGTHLFLCNWYRVLADVEKQIFAEPGDHAGEMETAFGLAYFPDLVRRDEQGNLRADDGAVASTRFEALNKGWVTLTRPWKHLTTNTGSGNPHAATAEKGVRMMRLLVERLAPFLVELSKSPLDERFPFH